MAHAPADIVQWAIARGTRVYNLTVTGDDVDERGLKAETQIQDGDILIAAPLACALTSTDALKRFGTLWKRFAKKTEVHTLAIELMHKVLTDPESVWVKALPAHVGNWPQWTEEERQFLSGNARVKQLLVQVLVYSTQPCRLLNCSEHLLVYSTQPFRLLNCSEQALGAGARSRCSEHLLVYYTQPFRLLSFHSHLLPMFQIQWLEISECERSEQMPGAGAPSRCSDVFPIT